MPRKKIQQEPKKYKAFCRVIIEVNFEDNGELSVLDQAHEAMMSSVDDCTVWDAEVTEIHDR